VQNRTGRVVAERNAVDFDDGETRQGKQTRAKAQILLDPRGAPGLKYSSGMGAAVTVPALRVERLFKRLGACRALDRGAVRLHGAPAALCARYAEPHLERPCLKCIRTDGLGSAARA
jgi:hypothetical protein